MIFFAEVHQDWANSEVAQKEIQSNIQLSWNSDLANLYARRDLLEYVDGMSLRCRSAWFKATLTGTVSTPIWFDNMSLFS